MSTTDLYKFRTICNMRGCHSFHAFLIKSSKKGLPIYWRWRGRLGTIVRKILLYFIQYIFLRSQNICHDATSPIHLQNYGLLSSSTGSLSLSYGFNIHVHFLPMYFPHFLELRHVPLLIWFFKAQKWGMSEKNIYNFVPLDLLYYCDFALFAFLSKTFVH